MNTKLPPKPLDNGGYLSRMAQKKTNSQSLEREALLKKHEFELAKLDEKHKKGATTSSTSKASK